MSSSASARILVIFGAVALAAATGGLWLAHSMQAGDSGAANQAVLRDGPFLRLPEPKPISDFALYDHAGRAFSKASLEGAWTLAFFGFSSCPHICPDTLYQLTRVVERLEGELPPDRVPEVLFIAVDPERDTPEALAQYRERFGEAIEAVSGPDPQLRALARQLGAHYVVPEHEPGQWYNVDHSTGVMLLDPSAHWVGLFSAPHEPEAMAETLRRYLAGRPARGAGG